MYSTHAAAALGSILPVGIEGKGVCLLYIPARIPTGREYWIVGNLESDTPGGRTGWTMSGVLGGRYAGTGTGAGAGVKTDDPGWCVVSTGCACAYAGDPGGREYWIVGNLESDIPGGRTGWTGSGAL